MRIFYKTGLMFFLSFFLFQSVIEAQLFEKLNGPNGGGAKVFEGKNGILFQFIIDHDLKRVVYRSLSGGGSWNRMPTPPANLSFDPIEIGLDGNLFAAKNEKLFTSTNNGQSWVSVNSPANEPISSVTSLPNGFILVSQSDKVFQSSDNGQSWNTFSLSGIDHFFFNKFTNQAYAINDNALYVSNDFGLTWQLFFADDFGYTVKNLISSSNGFVFVSGLGFIWKFNTTGNLIRKTNLVAGQDNPVNIALATSGKMFADENNNSFYSNNYGDNWIKLPTQGSDLNIFNFFSATSNGSIFGVKISGSLYRSIDNGNTWSFSANGLNHATVYEVEFISESRILALTSDGVFYTEDGGQNWNFIHPSNLYKDVYTETDRIIHLGDEILFSDNKDIYYFQDWKSPGVKIRSKFDNSVSDKLFVNSKTSTLFSLESNRLFRSFDKGKSWTAVSLPASDMEDLHSFPDGSMIAINTTNIFRSTDNGNTWSLILTYNFSDNNRILSDGFSTAYIYFYEGAWKLRKSIDNGISWQVVSIKDPNSLVIEPTHGQVSNNLGYLFTGSVTDEIFRSVDQGVNYKVYLDGIDLVTNLAISPQQKLYVLTEKNGLYRTKISTSSTRILTGNVFLDNNKNCLKESGEGNLSGRLIKAVNGNRVVYAYSDANGDFRLPVDQGDYTIEVSTNNNIWKSCIKTFSSATYNFNDTFYLGLQINSLCPFLEVDLQPSILRRCFETILYIDYANTGTLKADNAYIDVVLDPLFEFVSSSIPVSNQTGNVYRFLLGDIDENTSGYFFIKVIVSCNSTLGQIHCAEAHIYPDTTCVQTSQAIIRTAANCLGDSIELIIRNDGNANMTTPKKWSVIDLSISNNAIQTFDGATFYLNAGQVFTKRIASRNRVLFIAEQDESYPYNKSSRTEIISCAKNPLPGSPPLSISNLDEEEPYLSKFCLRNRGSFDPNDITGYPIGLTDKQYIDNEQELEYIIRFQNTGTDTAFNIRIENKMPTKELDLATLSLGASSHPYQLIISPEGKLIFSFSNILLPDSSINEQASHGFIHYRIKPIEKLSKGTKILNDALIYFDFNEGVNTNVDLHTVGIPVIVKVKEANDADEIDFLIEPNPMMESSTITIMSITKNRNYSLSCLDMNTRLLWKKVISNNKTNISRDELLAGIYFIVLKNENGIPLAIKKLMVK